WEVLYEPAGLCEHRRANLPERRAAMSPEVNYHSLKNRYLLRLYHQSGPNLLWTLPFALWRDLLALGYVLLRERRSLAAYRWLWANRRELLARRRTIQSRRTVPRCAIDRWFLRSALPLPAERATGGGVPLPPGRGGEGSRERGVVRKSGEVSPD
ncbi:MAG TPA: hypothetical protein VM599_11675, partial [Thermoanaerobaculia bacterium]|nr:hypothetical protein [Thermoanaerobaculia bacterium]